MMQIGPHHSVVREQNSNIQAHMVDDNIAIGWMAGGFCMGPSPVVS
jgi:hypothetical protein